MREQSYDNIPDSVEIPDLEEVPHVIEGKDLETLVVASKETLKRNYKNAAKRKFYIEYKNPLKVRLQKSISKSF